MKYMGGVIAYINIFFCRGLLLIFVWMSATWDKKTYYQGW